MKNLHFIQFLLLANILLAQKNPLPPGELPEIPKPIFEPICELPAYTMDAEFHSGKEGLARYIKNRLEYPKKARRKKITGTVVASFMIEKDGIIREIKILKSLPYGCDEAVINLIKRMPKWRPAMEEGKLVRFLYELPVEFELGEK